MKKVLLLAGIGLAGYGLYKYFNYQVTQALDYDYKIKNVHIHGVQGNRATVSVVLALRNKSNFEVTLSAYDLKVFYKDVHFASTASVTPVVIQPATTYDFSVSGEINLDTVKQSILPFVSDVLNRRPIEFEVSGFLKIVFLNIPSTIQFNREKVTYTVDFLKEYHLDTDYEKLKAKYPKIFSFFKLNN